MRWILLLALFLFAWGGRFVQVRPESLAGAESGSRVTPLLVRVDALVTDKEGKPVKGLTRDDFEILQDGVPQPLTSFSATELPNPGVRVRGSKPPALRNGLVPGEIRRTIAFVINNPTPRPPAYVSPVTKAAIQHVVDERMTDTDSAAIMTTQGEAGIYSQFSSDPALLGSTLKWTSPGIDLTFRYLRKRPRANFHVPAGPEIEWMERIASQPPELAIRAMRDLPGHKSLLLFSSGYPFLLVGARLDRIADEATRSGVTVYSIHDPQASKWAPKPDPGSLVDFARITGGIFYTRTNHWDRMMDEIMDDQSSFYSLGYDPKGAASRDGFHTIEVRVKRRDLLVRSPTGFLGQGGSAAPEPAPKPETDTEKTNRLLLQPLRATDIRTRLTSGLRVHDSVPQVQNYLWIDAKNLTFTRDAQQSFVTQLDIAARCHGAFGTMPHQVERIYQLRLNARQHTEALRSGFAYYIACPVAMPGPYQLRVAVRELGSEKVGTATQFLEVPDVMRNELTLSGIASDNFGRLALPDAILEPAFGRLILSRRITWQTQVFGAKWSGKTLKLSARVEVFRSDGMLVQETPLQPMVAKVADTKRKDVSISGKVELPADQPGGDYVVRVTVRDDNRREHDPSRQASQWTPLEAGPVE